MYNMYNMETDNGLSMDSAQVRRQWASTLNKVKGGERIVITHYRGAVAALMPKSDFDRIKAVPTLSELQSLLDIQVTETRLRNGRRFWLRDERPRVGILEQARREARSIGIDEKQLVMGVLAQKSTAKRPFPYAVPNLMRRTDGVVDILFQTIDDDDFLILYVTAAKTDEGRIQNICAALGAEPLRDETIQLLHDLHSKVDALLDNAKQRHDSAPRTKGQSRGLG